MTGEKKKLKVWMLSLSSQSFLSCSCLLCQEERIPCTQHYGPAALYCTALRLQEAGKLYEYVTTVERSLQAAEILQAVGNRKEKERAKWMKAAGLIEIRRITVSKNKLRCVLSVMQPIPEPVPVLSESSSSSSSSSEGTESVNDEGTDGLQTSNSLVKKLKSQHDVVPRFSAGELVLGFVDDCSSDSTESGSGSEGLSVRELLCSMTEEAEQLSLNSIGLVAEEVTVQPVLLSMAVQALTQLTDLIAPAPVPVVQQDEAEAEEGVDIDYEEHMKSTSKFTKVDVNADGAGKAGEDEGVDGSPVSAVEAMPTLSAAGLALPSKISVVGQSVSQYTSAPYSCSGSGSCYFLVVLLFLILAILEHY